MLRTNVRSSLLTFGTSTNFTKVRTNFASTFLHRGNPLWIPAYTRTRRITPHKGVRSVLPHTSGQRTSGRMSYTNWCFTLNNPDTLLDLDDPNIRYSIYSEEQGTTYHFQGYIQLYNKQRLSWMQKLIPGAHFEVQRAKNNDDARNYCAKVGDDTFISGPYETGTYTKVGARTDLIAVKEDLDAGVPMLDIAERHFANWTRYHRSFTLYRTMKMNRRKEIHSVTVIYGSTGTGKTTYAEECTANGAEIYWVDRPNNGAYYFEDYRDEDWILLDDFYGWLPQDFLLRLCQPKELRLPFRGGTHNCCATNIIFTTNKRPWTWYKRDMSNFVRRVTKWIHFTDYMTCYETDDFQRFKDSILNKEFTQ